MNTFSSALIDKIKIAKYLSADKIIKINIIQIVSF